MTDQTKTPDTKTRRSDAETLLRFGSAVGVPRSPITSDLEAFIEPENGTPYLVAPNDYYEHSLEHLLPAPQTWDSQHDHCGEFHRVHQEAW